MLKVDFSDVDVCMLTQNEETILEATLPALSAKFSSFVIIDQSSSDRTLELIRDILGDRAKIFVEPKDYIIKNGFAGARNRASELCSKPWIFHVDADEQVVSPSGDDAITADGADDSKQFLSVPRRNLGKPSEIDLPLDNETIARLPIVSTESHVRLYRNHVGLRWRSFIHEELWLGGRRLPYRSPECSISLNHLSLFKGSEVAVDKEAFYAWMLLQGADRPAGDEGSLSDYCRHVLEERKEYFTAMSESYVLKMSSERSDPSTAVAPLKAQREPNMPIHPAGFLQRTFSQCGEDTFLLQNFFHDKRDGFYVDIGAHHPFRYSNTAIFHEWGWRGINIDVDERAIDAFKTARPNDINILSGVAAEPGNLTAYIFNEGAVNTFSAEVAADYKTMNGWHVIAEKTVPVRPVWQILDEYVPSGQEIDIMDIDVEGMDEEVLKSNNWDKYRPKALLVEVHGANIYTIQENPIVKYLAQQGYEVAGILTLTTIFRRIR